MNQRRCHYRNIVCEFEQQDDDSSTKHIPKREDCERCIRLMNAQMRDYIKLTHIQIMEKLSHPLFSVQVDEPKIGIKHTEKLIDKPIDESIEKWWLISAEDITEIRKDLITCQNHFSCHGRYGITIVDNAIHLLDSGLHTTDAIPGDFKVQINKTCKDCYHNLPTEGCYYRCIYEGNSGIRDFMSRMFNVPAIDELAKHCTYFHRAGKRVPKDMPKEYCEAKSTGLFDGKVENIAQQLANNRKEQKEREETQIGKG